MAVDSQSRLYFISVKHLHCLYSVLASEQKVGHILTMSCNILYLAVSEPCYWHKELLFFLLKDRHDIRSDPLAVRIICPVSFHKATKDTEKSPSTKTKPLTWILSLCSFHVLFFYHSLSLHISLCLLIRPLISICAHILCFLFTQCSSFTQFVICK